MTKKIMRIVTIRAKLYKSKIAMKLVTMLILFGTVLTFASATMPDDGNVSSNDLQQRRVTGRVVDATGNPLPGVNVIEKGTTNGAITEANGSYSLTVASPGSILTFSFIGFSTQEVIVGSLSTVDIVLIQAVSALDEIVVVGYSTQARKSLTGSVTTVDASTLSEATSSNPMQRLQGKVAGVTILNQHTPGEGSTIRIRGMTTINNANPLYVVDGVPGGSYSANDVESITILKDAAAQSIYGARAANGVVLVTTKGGRKNQKVSFNVNVRQGITRNMNYYDLLNTQEWGEMLWLEAKNAGITNFNHVQYGNGAEPVIPYYIFPTKTAEGSPLADPSLYDNKMTHEDGDDTYLIARASVPGTDWMREADRNAPFIEYTMDASGGTANTTYAFMLAYTKEDGVFRYTGYDRYNGRANITSSPAKWLEIGTNIGVTYYNDHGHQTDNGETSLVSWSYRVPPIVPVYDIAGNYGGTRSAGCGNAQTVMFLSDKNQYDYTRRLTLSGNAHVSLFILKGLALKSLIGINQYGQNAKDINFVEVAAAERGTYDYYSQSAAFNLNWTWTNTIEYSGIFGQHNFKVIGGAEAYNTNGFSIAANRSEYSLKDINYMNLDRGLRSINNSGSGESGYSLFSLFGRINYTYADKYMLEAVVRRDGSSRFGEQKYGVFPAFSVGWRLSEEEFMANTKDWLNELKLRAGYGAVGNQEIDNYNSYDQFVLNFNNSFYPITGSNSVTGATGFYQSRFGNADVKWEATTTTNVGIDATIFKNLTLAFDVWQRRTKDMLYPKQLPLVYGTASTPSINIGEMKNTGFDIELGYVNSALNGDLTYGADLVFSHYKNELVKLTDNVGDFYQGTSYREMPYTRTQSGKAFPEFYGYIVDGIFQSDAEATDYAPIFGGANNKAGYFKYRDVSGPEGVPDGVVDSNDRTWIGSPHPAFTAGLSFNVDYKGFFLSTTLYSTVGNEVVNYVSRFIDYTQFESGKSHRRLYESWGSPYLNGDNTKATMPIILADDTPHQQPSTAFLEDGSFLRMKTLRIGYDLNKILNNKFNTLQIYFQASNLFTLTKYPGLDPEISGAGINMGIDSGAWPTPQQLIFGIAFGL